MANVTKRLRSKIDLHTTHFSVAATSSSSSSCDVREKREEGLVVVVRRGLLAVAPDCLIVPEIYFRPRTRGRTKDFHRAHIFSAPSRAARMLLYRATSPSRSVTISCSAAASEKRDTRRVAHCRCFCSILTTMIKKEENLGPETQTRNPKPETQKDKLSRKRCRFLLTFLSFSSY